MSRAWTRKTLLPAALLLMVGLRLIALRSDPYPRLDWSAGLLTDEGFYVHNARNVALFGHARTDEFNNMLLAPLLHGAQVVVFAVFGVGAMQARMISVACSLLALWLLWDALRRAFDRRIALTAVLFLGLDHTNLLYSRMALMDTPAALGAVAAFYAFVRSQKLEVSSQKSVDSNQKIGWLVVCGLLLGLTVVNRTLCVYLLPVPFLALSRPWSVAREQIKGSLPALILPLLAVFALWYGAWYTPNRAEIGRMNRYYRTEQIQPKSAGHLAENLQHAVLGDHRGLSPYLFRHTPVVFSLALLWVVGSWSRKESRVASRKSQVVSEGTQNSEPGTDDSRLTTHDSRIPRYLTAWLLLGWGLLAVIGYSPSRYYVTTYPALAALAALALWRLPELFAALASNRWQARALRGALAWFLAYHAVEAVVHHRGVLPRVPTLLLLYGAPTVIGALLWVVGSWDRKESRVASRESKDRGGEGARGRAGDSDLSTHDSPLTTHNFLLSILLVVWLVFNACWLGHWLTTLRGSQYAMSRWLAENLPAGSVLLGDVAPGVSLDNPFVAVNVIPGLCNDDRPVEKYAGRPRYLVILDYVKNGHISEPWWRRNYPEVAAAPQRPLYRARVLRWDVGVYAIESRRSPVARDR